MFRFLTFISVLFVFTPASGQRVSKVAFYNVENLFDTLDHPEKNDNEFLPDARRMWNTEKYNQKLQHINQVLDSLGNPIIVGLCEIENKQVVQDLLDTGNRKDSYGIIHYESLDQRGIDNAIIYNRHRLKMTESGIIRFDMPEPHSPSRDIVWAKFVAAEYVNHQDTILVMVNHWPSRRGGQVESEPKRLVAALAANSFIDSTIQANKDMKIVFMGDLNDDPGNRCPQFIADHLEPMITEQSGVFGGSHNYQTEWHIMDHIFVSKSFMKGKGINVVKKSGTIHSPDFLLTEYKGHTVPSRTFGGLRYFGGYSDHLPVSIDLKLPKVKSGG